MLPKMHRLVADKDFARLFAKGKSWHGKGVSVKAIKNGKDSSRIGFVVSTKIDKRAVVRNQIKRRMREIVRKHLSGLYKGADIVFSARAEAKTMAFTELHNELVGLLVRSGLIEKPRV